MKAFLKIICLSFMIVTGIFLYACTASIITPKISIDDTSIELRIGDPDNETKAVDFVLSDYGNGNTTLNFSTDNPGLVTYTSEYIGSGKTRLIITGVEPGMATITARSLQGGATNTITVKVTQPLQSFSLKNIYLGKICVIKGGSLNLNLSDLYSFSPLNTNEKDLKYSILTSNSDCSISNGILNVGENCNLNSVKIKAAVKNDENKFIEFDVKILKPILTELKVGYATGSQFVVGLDTNSDLKIYFGDENKNIAVATLTITADISSEILNITQIFNSSKGKFLVSQINYEYSNGQHIYTYTIQANTTNAGQTDKLIFDISYANYNNAGDNYVVSTNTLNISSYNVPTSIKVNNQTDEVDIELFANTNLKNGKMMEFSVLPDNLESETNAERIRIWADDINSLPVTLYKLNATRTAICVYGLYNGVFVGADIGYYEFTSGTKLYAFVNTNYAPLTNQPAVFYVQSALYHDKSNTNDRAKTKINFVINPNAQNIYLANLENDNLLKNDLETINIKLGEEITQYIAISPSNFIISGSSYATISKANIASLGEIIPAATSQTDYSFASFKIKALQLGSTKLTIVLSDGKTKEINLNVISTPEEININLEDLVDNVESDIIAFTNVEDISLIEGQNGIYHHIEGISLNKISIANSGSTIQFLQTVYPSTAQYYLTYSYCDLDPLINITTYKMTLEQLEEQSFKDTSDTLKVASMNNFSVIEAYNSRTEGNILLKIDVHGMRPNGNYDVIGNFYYLINFFIPVSSLKVTNGTLELYPYQSIGDLFVNANGQNKSLGTFSVAINSVNGSVNPTYINTLKMYVNGNFKNIEFKDNFCYLDINGEQTYLDQEIVLRITRTITGNIYTFNVQAYKQVPANYILTFVVTEVYDRKITGVARIFIADVTEISDIDLINIDDNGIYFDNRNNSNKDMQLEIITNVYSAGGKEITNDNLYFEFIWDFAFNRTDNIFTMSNSQEILKSLIILTRNANGNYDLVVNQNFGGSGIIKIYPESNYFGGWNGEDANAYYEIPIIVANGMQEETALRIYTEQDFIDLLEKSVYEIGEGEGKITCPYYFSLQNNLIIDSAKVDNFGGNLNGNDYTISIKGPLFKNILPNGNIKNLNIYAVSDTAINCDYYNYYYKYKDRKIFGYLACLNKGIITNVNILDANTNFKSVDGELYALGLLVGINEGEIKYNDSDEINIYGTNDFGATHAGGIVGYDVGSDVGSGSPVYGIYGARVSVTISGYSTGKFSGNVGDTTYKGAPYNCTDEINEINNFSAILNPKNQDDNDKNNLTASQLITSAALVNSGGSANIILYYYDIVGQVLNDTQEEGYLKNKNTFKLEDLLKLSVDGEPQEGYANFKITSSNSNVIKTIGASLEIKNIGKVTLTITPKISSDKPIITLNIYVVYPINDYRIFEGANAEDSNNIINNGEVIRFKKSEIQYLTTYVNNKISLNNILYTIKLNDLVLQLEKLNEFNYSGIYTDYNKNGSPDSYLGLGAMSLNATELASNNAEYELYSNLALLNTKSINTITIDDIELLNGLLAQKFYKNFKLEIYTGAQNIRSSITGAQIDPSNVLTINVVLTSDVDVKDEGLDIEIIDDLGVTIWGENVKNIFNVVSTRKNKIDDKINYTVLVYIRDKAGINDTKNYIIKISAKSEQNINLSIDLILKPQEIISVTYSHYNRDDSSKEESFVVKNEPSSVLSPGDSGLLILDYFPSYASFSRIVIESATVNGNYVLMEQMYLNGDRYLSATNNANYSSFRQANRLTINNKGINNERIYVRTKILSTVSEGLNFSITIKIYMKDENGAEKLVKNEEITLVTQVVDGAIITINNGKEAVVLRGYDNEIKISVPLHQNLSDCNIFGKNIGTNKYDTVEVYFYKSEYEIIGGRKVYTGFLRIGLNAELTGEDADGIFQVQTIVSKVINGREVSSIDSITVNVMDFLIKEIYIKGNNEEDNVFDTPLAIEKEFEFEFILSKTPGFYRIDQVGAIDRINNAKDYFLKNMAYKYATDKYSYIINTSRIFIKNTAWNGEFNDAITHEVSKQESNSIAYNLYYTNNSETFVEQEDQDQYVSIKYNKDADLSDFDNKSNLLKITGKKVGAVGFTLKIGYKLPGATTISYITYDFYINVQPYSDEDKPTPIYTAQQFTEYLSSKQENYSSTNYILMNNIILENFEPFIETYFDSLDGNNKIITIKNFVTDSVSNILNLGLFITVNNGSTLKNLTVNYYELDNIIVNEVKHNIINVAGLAIYNYGIIYNCEVITLDKNSISGHDADCGIRVYFDEINKLKAKEDSTAVKISGLVINNYVTGCITNSRVGGYTFTTVEGNSSSATTSETAHKNINIIGQGDISGFVNYNVGVISASYFANGNIINNSISGTESLTSGFVLNNAFGASINGCYVEGIRAGAEVYVTGGGIIAQGITSGFTHLNEGKILNCYTNIKLAGTSSGRIVSGFIYNNKNKGHVESCYSSSTISGELTTQMPFTGINARGEKMQEVENGLINCYYIVSIYNEGSVLEEKYSTGAVGLSYNSLTADKLYGLAFVSDKNSQDGNWYWNGIHASLVEANNIAISARYIIENYSDLIKEGESLESVNAFPYIKGYEYGSAKNPIIIRDANEYNRAFGQEAQLTPNTYYAISQMYDRTRGVVFGCYRLVSHINFNNLTIIENVKITSSIMNLTKKGENKGIFDGNGLTISNIEINLDSRDIVGLISKLTNSAVFKYVDLTIVKIEAGDGVYVGGAIGYVENSFASNINVTPVITAFGDDKSQIVGHNIVGGVVGYVAANSRISNLTSSISVVSSLTTSTKEYDRIGQSLDIHKTLSYSGGVVGIVDIYDDIFTTAVYTDKITANKLKYFGANVTVQGEYVGGVAGYVGKSTYFVDSLFEITGVQGGTFHQKLITYGSAIGGIVGINYGKLFQIRIEHQTDTQLVIENNLEKYYDTSANIFRGITTLFNVLGASDSDVIYMGGLVGKMMKGELITSYAKIDVTNARANYVGGLIGLNQANTVFNELYAFGDVNAQMSGGLIGENKGNISIINCVAMNFYNKDNSNLLVAKTFLDWVNKQEDIKMPLKQIEKTTENSEGLIKLKFENDSAIIVKNYKLTTGEYDKTSLEEIKSKLGDALFFYEYKRVGVNVEILSNGEKFWIKDSSIWKELTEEPYNQYGFSYRYHLGDTIYFYGIKEKENQHSEKIYIDPIIEKDGMKITLPTTKNNNEIIERLIIDSEAKDYLDELVAMKINAKYENVTYNGSSRTIYEGTSLIDGESGKIVYCYLINCTAVSAEDKSNDWGNRITTNLNCEYIYYTNKTYTGSYEYLSTIPVWPFLQYRTDYNASFSIDNLIYRQNSINYFFNARKIVHYGDSNEKTSWNKKDGSYSWDLNNTIESDLIITPGIYEIKQTGGYESYVPGRTDITITENTDSITLSIKPENTTSATLNNLGSILGKNSALCTVSGIYATNKIIIGDYTYNIASIHSNDKINQTAIYVKDLKITNGNIAAFNKNSDTITSNQMFIGAGWETSFWIKEKNRLFPRLNFGFADQVLYIEKPSDLAKLYKYSDQSNTVIFGNDPSTLFNPYKYDPTDNKSWGEFTSEMLEGLIVDKQEGTKKLKFDLSNLDSILEANGLGISDTYFSRFLGTMYGEENEDFKIIISGTEKTFFEEIIGGSVSNLIFGDSEPTSLDGPVLADLISDETELNNLIFQNIDIDSPDINLGIIAGKMVGVNEISDIEINNCTIKSTSSTTDKELNIGGVAGLMQDGDPAASYKKISIKNIKIDAVGDGNLKANNVNAGLIFGQIDFGAEYTDCFISVEEDTEKNLININANGSITVGGYAGYASVTNQTITKGEDPNVQFIENLYILINGNENTKVNAGLMFGQANVINNNEETKISGFISNKYKFESDGNLKQKNSPPVFANIGGVVGNGSVNISNLEISGLNITINEDLKNNRLIDFATKTGTLENDKSKVGGVIGNSSNIILSNITVTGAIITNNTGTKNSADILYVGGAIGYNNGTFNILNIECNSNIQISETVGTSKTEIYTGGIVGYAFTNGTGVFIIGTSSGDPATYSNGAIFEGSLTIEGAEKVYAGGIIGTTSDAIDNNPKSKINIYDSKVSGDININSVYYNETSPATAVYVGGVAGYVVADICGSYAWGNITLADGLNINELYVGGIVAQLDGIDDTANGKANFNSNYSMTSIYNENRGTNHLIRALIGKQITSANVATSENFYCHQINLAVDVDTVGENLYYYKFVSGETGTSILDKFEAKELTTNITLGSKLNPIKAAQDTATFDSNEYYVLTNDIDASSSKDINGHLVGDGYTLTATDRTPFGTISGKISGIYIQNTITSDSKSGFATTNSGIVFACSAKITAASNTLSSGFVNINSGLIADCGVVLLVEGATAGFTDSNTGVISNSYVTGAVIEGATYGFNDGSNGKVINCYTAIKTLETIFNGTCSNCYYDINATEKLQEKDEVTQKTTDEMSTSNDKATAILTSISTINPGNIINSPSNEQTLSWKQNYAINYGYPTLSAGAYANFTYMEIGTGDGETSSIQIPNGGKLAQINKDLGKNYILINSINLYNAGYIANNSWTPIGLNSDSSFSGIFDGAGYTISDIPSIIGIQYAGFFGYLAGGTIKNCNFTYKSGGLVQSTATDGETYAGGVVAFMNSGSLENITVDQVAISNAHYAGGIVGRMADGTLNNCATKDTVSVGGVADTASPNAGGIVGYIVNTSETGIINCDNYATVTATSYAGGIVGYMTAGIIGVCESNGVIKISSWSTGTTFAGGIVGYMSIGEIGNCTNKGNVSGINSSSYIGGIAGILDIASTNQGLIRNCKNEGNVNTGGNAGGLVGTLAGEGHKIIADSKNSGIISGSYAGGIAGVAYNNVTWDDFEVEILGCLNEGNVTGTSYAAGILGNGEADTKIYSDCSNSGTISAQNKNNIANGTEITLLTITVQANILYESTYYITEIFKYLGYDGCYVYYNLVMSYFGHIESGESIEIAMRTPLPDNLPKFNFMNWEINWTREGNTYPIYNLIATRIWN